MSFLTLFSCTQSKINVRLQIPEAVANVRTEPRTALPNQRLSPLGKRKRGKKPWFIGLSHLGNQGRKKGARTAQSAVHTPFKQTKRPDSHGIEPICKSRDVLLHVASTYSIATFSDFVKL